MSTPDLEDDISKQIKNIMADPVSNPENAIKQLRVEGLLVERRVKRIEGVAWWLITTILAASLGVMGTVVWAAFSLGTRMEALTQVSARVGALEERLARSEH